MSEMDRDRYLGLLDYDPRTHYQRPHIRDEAVLRTACGCEKIVSVPNESQIYQARIQLDHLDPSLGSFDVKTDVHMLIRRFIWVGRNDDYGRRIFEERVESQEPWKHRYQELYRDVYGMDKGL